MAKLIMEKKNDVAMNDENSKTLNPITEKRQDVEIKENQVFMQELDFLPKFDSEMAE